MQLILGGTGGPIIRESHNTATIGQSLIRFRGEFPHLDKVDPIPDLRWCGYRRSPIKGVFLGQDSIDPHLRQWGRSGVIFEFAHLQAGLYSAFDYGFLTDPRGNSDMHLISISPDDEIEIVDSISAHRETFATWRRLRSCPAILDHLYANGQDSEAESNLPGHLWHDEQSGRNRVGDEARRTRLPALAGDFSEVKSAFIVRHDWIGLLRASIANETRRVRNALDEKDSFGVSSSWSRLHAMLAAFCRIRLCDKAAAILDHDGPVSTFAPSGDREPLEPGKIAAALLDDTELFGHAEASREGGDDCSSALIAADLLEERGDLDRANTIRIYLALESYRFRLADIGQDLWEIADRILPRAG